VILITPWSDAAIVGDARFQRISNWCGREVTLNPKAVSGCTAGTLSLDDVEAEVVFLELVASWSAPMQINTITAVGAKRDQRIRSLEEEAGASVAWETSGVGAGAGFVACSV
jgi:hypothetical protein